MPELQGPGDMAAIVIADDDDLALDAPSRGSADELLDAGAHAPLDSMRHSAAHVMAEAVLDLFPDARLGIGPAIAEGFYYDFDLPRPLTPEDLAAIEERMRASVAADTSLRPRRSRPFAEARATSESAGQSYKVEILDDLASRRAETAGEPLPVTTFYEPRVVRDLCKGPHVERRAQIGPFKLLAVAGAYWRGDEKRPMLQRIYGTVWETQEAARPVPLARGPRRRSATTAGSASSSTCSASTTCRPGSAFWHPKGWTPVSDAGGRDARAPGRGADTRRSTPRCWSTRSCGSSPATGTSTASTCSCSRPRRRRTASSR